MKEVKIDFTSYSLEQLVSSLEAIDDRQYPDQAIEIYNLLTKALETNSQIIDSRYTENNFIDDLLDFVFSFSLIEMQPTKSEMREKLTRIRAVCESIQT